MKKTFKVILIMILLGGVLVSGLAFYVGAKLLNSSAGITFDKLKLLEVYAKTEIYDDSDSLLDEQLYSHRATANLSEIPQHVKDAFLSIEDKKFYSHDGLNYARIMKAVLHNISSPFTSRRVHNKPATY